MDRENGPSRKQPDSKGASGGQNILWYLLVAGLAIVAVTLLLAQSAVLEISYYDFKRLVDASRRDGTGQLLDAPGYIDVRIELKEGKSRIDRYQNLREVQNGTQTLTGKVDRIVNFQPVDVVLDDASQPSAESGDTRSSVNQKQVGIAFRTYKPASGQEDFELLERLRTYHIEHSNEAGPGLWRAYVPLLLITGLFVLLFIVMMRRLSGAGSPMSFGRSRGRLYAQEDIGVTFNDVAGIDEAVEEVREVVDFLRSPEKYQRLGGRIPKGVLLVGPPGTGKTLLAKAIAGEAGVPFYSLSGSDFVEMFVGVGAARVRDMFQQAVAKAPCIIFIDELDALGKSRGGSMIGGHDEREQTLNALLVEMDGFESNTSVIVISATNRPETLDQALLRPGRFDRTVLVDRPDIAGREQILKVHVKSVKLDSSVDLRRVAAITPGFVGADLANLVNEAALLAARKEKSAVGMAEFNDGVERVTAGLEKKQRVMSDDEKQRVAYHEAGHALVACSLPNTDPVHKVSIIPRGIAALGYTMQRPEGDRFLMTQSELESRIQVLLGGTLTEELIFEDISTGAQNDLERATEIARSMVTDFGMSRLGRVNYRESSRNVFLTSAGDERSRSHSEKTAREIDEEIRRIIEEAIEKVRQILATRRNALEAMTRRLIDVESIDSEELAEIIELHSPGPRIVPGTQPAPRGEGKPATPADAAQAEQTG
jgi:cell division protease FtsH